MVSQLTYVFAPPPAYSLPVHGTRQRLAVNRLFFVGRNYHAHAVEMGRPVDKTVEVPFYFTKSPSTLVESGGTVPYPPQTMDYQHEMELAARDKGRPWDLGKDFEQSSVVSQMVPMPGVVLEKGELALSVNGKLRQKSDLSKLIWSIRELIADLSKFYHLRPGDLIFTGTPEGVGAVLPGDRIEGLIEGVGKISLIVGAAD